jgi:hypothetical protein
MNLGKLNKYNLIILGLNLLGPAFIFHPISAFAGDSTQCEDWDSSLKPLPDLDRAMFRGAKDKLDEQFGSAEEADRVLMGPFRMDSGSKKSTDSNETRSERLFRQYTIIKDDFVRSGKDTGDFSAFKTWVLNPNWKPALRDRMLMDIYHRLSLTSDDREEFQSNLSKYSSNDLSLDPEDRAVLMDMFDHDRAHLKQVRPKAASSALTAGMVEPIIPKATAGVVEQPAKPQAEVTQAPTVQNLPLGSIAKETVIQQSESNGSVRLIETPSENALLSVRSDGYFAKLPDPTKPEGSPTSPYQLYAGAKTTVRVNLPGDSSISGTGEVLIQAGTKSEDKIQAQSIDPHFTDARVGFTYRSTLPSVLERIFDPKIKQNVDQIFFVVGAEGGSHDGDGRVAGKIGASYRSGKGESAVYVDGYFSAGSQAGDPLFGGGVRVTTGEHLQCSAEFEHSLRDGSCLLLNLRADLPEKRYDSNLFK